MYQLRPHPWTSSLQLIYCLCFSEELPLEQGKSSLKCMYTWLLGILISRRCSSILPNIKSPRLSPLIPRKPQLASSSYSIQSMEWVRKYDARFDLQKCYILSSPIILCCKSEPEGKPFRRPTAHTNNVNDRQKRGSISFSTALMNTNSIMKSVMWSFFALEHGSMAVQTRMQTQVVALSHIALLYLPCSH